MKCRQCNIIGILTFLVLAGLVYFSYQDQQQPQESVQTQSQIIINNKTLNVDIVTTPQDQARGLGGKTDLADDYGMLFVFSDERIRQFWMKDMLVPIDIIWIQNNRIVGYVDSVQPEPGVSLSQLKIYSSEIPVDKVLEVRAGLRLESGWEVGSIVEF